MATIIPFPKAMPVPGRGLSKQECDVLDSEAREFILDGQASGVTTHNDGQYMCVFGPGGAPLMINRQNGLCYLFDNNEMMLARSQRFEIVLQALEAALALFEDEPA